MTRRSLFASLAALRPVPLGKPRWEISYLTGLRVAPWGP